jgi:hypothetical protein
MVVLKKQYIYSAKGKPVAVVMDIDTFKKIEEILDDIEDVKIIEARFGEPDLNWDEIKSGF